MVPLRRSLSTLLLVLAAWPAWAQTPSIEVIDPGATTTRMVIVRLGTSYYYVETTLVKPTPAPGPIPPNPVPPQPQPEPEPTPPPIPPPEPIPAPYTGKLWVLYIAQDNDSKAWGLAVDSMLRSSLASANAELRTYKTSEENITRQNLTKAIADAGGPPVVLIQKADGRLARSVKPTSAAAITEAVKAVREGKP